tara:strand:+ start:122 stop:1015 length:894 start_codon:yes stop_codon:yes gene_type:complete
MKLIIKSRRLRLPKFRLPKLRTNVGFPDIDFAIPKVVTKVSIGGNFKKMAGVSLSIAALVVVVAISFAAVGVEQAKQFPTAAEYTVRAGDTSVGIGEDIRGSDAADTQTLKLNIGGARISDIIIDDLEVGATTGITYSLEITTGGASVWIECDEVLIDNLTAPSLTISNAEIYNLIVQNNKADGNSFSPTLANGIVDVTLNSTRGTVNIPEISGSDYDRIHIDAATSAQCRKLHIKNVSSYGFPVLIDHIKAGTVTVTNSQIGSGTGIDSADFIIANTVKISGSTLTGNIEVPISVK